MRKPGRVVLAWAIIAATGVSGHAGEERVSDLHRLAAGLDLTGGGVRNWLERLGVTDDGGSVERLLAVSTTGEPVLEREGGGSSVRVDPELDGMLLRPEMEIVLVHNHPASVGLSVADLRQLTKPGVVAIAAIGHDGSVFIASASPRLDREFFQERQYERAKAEVQKRLRAEWPSGRVSVPASDSHLSHLVTLALARAGIVRYWFELRGSGRESYRNARSAFGQVVAGAAARLRDR